MNSPSAVKALSAPMAAPSVSVGRMIETDRELAIEEDRRLGHDQVGLASFTVGVEVGKGHRYPVTGSTAVRGGALPALSCQVWKCIISLPPMLSRIRSTSVWVTRWASEA